MEQRQLRGGIRLLRTAELPLAAIRDHWIAVGLSTAPADRERAEAGVRLAYRNAGLPQDVRFIWALSPMSGANTAEALMRRATVPRLPADEVKPAALMPPGIADHISPDESVAIRQQLIEPIVASVSVNVWRPVKQQIAKSVRQPVAAPAYGQHDVLSVALAEVLRHKGLEIAGMPAAAEIAESCGWWWPFDDVCVLSERPSVAAFDECGQLHSASGPALVYPDGWSIHAWHGVVVDSAVIQRPDLITPSQIQHQTDPGIQHALLECYGLERYAHDTGTRLARSGARTEISGPTAAAGQPPAIEPDWVASIFRR